MWSKKTLMFLTSLSLFSASTLAGGPERLSDELGTEEKRADEVSPSSFISDILRPILTAQHSTPADRVRARLTLGALLRDPDINVAESGVSEFEKHLQVVQERQGQGHFDVLADLREQVLLEIMKDALGSSKERIPESIIEKIRVVVSAHIIHLQKTKYLTPELASVREGIYQFIFTDIYELLLVHLNHETALGQKVKQSIAADATNFVFLRESFHTTLERFGTGRHSVHVLDAHVSTVMTQNAVGLGQFLDDEKAHKLGDYLLKRMQDLKGIAEHFRTKHRAP